MSLVGLVAYNVPNGRKLTCVDLHALYQDIIRCPLLDITFTLAAKVPEKVNPTFAVLSNSLDNKWFIIIIKMCGSLQDPYVRCE